MSRIPVHAVTLGLSDNGLLTPFNTLGCLVAYAKVHEGGVLASQFDFGKITPTGGRDPDTMRTLEAAGGGIVLLSSYIWNHHHNLAFAREVKARVPTAFVVMGGPHVPREAMAQAIFMKNTPEVDVAVRGEGELTLAELLMTLAKDPRGGEALAGVDLSEVNGLAFRQGGKLRRTPDRERTKDLGAFPSPFLTGEFDHWFASAPLIPLETNRGCPYGCSFCDWGAATLQKIHKMSDERVYGELEYAGMKKTGIAGFCDANFGVLPRDVDIAHHLVRVSEKYGYPREVGFCSAKVATPRLLEIAKSLHRAGLLPIMQSSVQTTDPTTLAIVDRANIKTEEYEKMIAAYRAAEIPVAIDLMVGLPGQTVESCKTDLQFVFDRRLTPVIYATSLMPNAPMASAEYRERHKIEIDEEGFVQSTFSFTREGYAAIFDLCIAYKFLVKLGFARFLVYYMQLEHDVKGLDFVERWLHAMKSGDARYPISGQVWSRMLSRKYENSTKHWLVAHWSEEDSAFLYDDLGSFLGELVRFYAEAFDAVAGGSALDAILEAQAAIIPCKSRDPSTRVELPHDVVAYFAELRKAPPLPALAGRWKPLVEYGPGVLQLGGKPENVRYGFADLNTNQCDLELPSDVQF